MNSPTWKKVADVLKAINLNELGLNIEKVYITGIFNSATVGRQEMNLAVVCFQN